MIVRDRSPVRTRQMPYGSFGSIADGTLVRADSGDTDAIWYIDQGQRRHITNMATVYGLQAMGHGGVVTVLASDLSRVPVGPDMSSPSDLLTKVINIASGGGSSSTSSGRGGMYQPVTVSTGSGASKYLTPTNVALGLGALAAVAYFARHRKRN